MLSVLKLLIFVIPPISLNMNYATKLTILYVDDDSDDCMFLKTSMENAGHKANLICATDGEEAVNYLNSVNSDALPSLIVLDLNMPRWDGRKTLTYLKSQPHLASIPVVIMSTSDNKREKEACQQMGAAAYQVKPYNFNDYKGVVDNLFAVIKD